MFFSESCIPDSPIPASLQLVLPSGLCSCRKDPLHTFHGTLYANCLWLESYGPEEVRSCMFLCFCGITSLLSPHTLNLHVYKFFTFKEGCIFICLGRIHMYACMWGYVWTRACAHVCMCMHAHLLVWERERGGGSFVLQSSSTDIYTSGPFYDNISFSDSLFHNITVACIYSL